MTDQSLRYDNAGVLRRLMRKTASTPATARFFARTLHKLDKPLLRRSGGKRSLTTWLTGLPIVELTTTGARTGQPRTMPIVGVPDGDRLVLIASNYGQTRNPAWYYNLKANPRCSVAFRGQHLEMRAREVDGEERQRLWDRNLAIYPTWDSYAKWAPHRHIPVLVLEPITASPRGE